VGLAGPVVGKGRAARRAKLASLKDG